MGQGDLFEQQTKWTSCHIILLFLRIPVQKNKQWKSASSCQCEGSKGRLIKSNWYPEFLYLKITYQRFSVAQGGGGQRGPIFVSGTGILHHFGMKCSSPHFAWSYQNQFIIWFVWKDMWEKLAVSNKQLVTSTFNFPCTHLKSKLTSQDFNTNKFRTKQNKVLLNAPNLTLRRFNGILLIMNYIIIFGISTQCWIISFISLLLAYDISWNILRRISLSFPAQDIK